MLTLYNTISILLGVKIRQNRQIKVIQLIEFIVEKVANIMGNRENAGY